MPESLDTSTLRTWARVALGRFAAARAEIDSLNVFPVPDGDTGTNLFLTFETAVASVEDLFGEGDEDQPGAVTRDDVSEALSKGALLGARGNSGVITSQILRGFAGAMKDGSDNATGDPQVLANALAEAANLAYSCVGQPQEGTILTVIRVAAESASGCIEGDPESGLATVAEAAVAGARDALARTPEQLEVLARAGVVDAGGAGCVVLLDALLEAITGIHDNREGQRIRPSPANPEPVRSDAIKYGGPAYEVMFLIDAPDDRVPHLRDRLTGLGDCLVVVGGDGLWNVHVHVDDIGAAIEAGIEAGRPYRIKVTHLDGAQGRAEPDLHGLDRQRAGRVLVAVAHGPGVAALLMDEGVVPVMALPGRRPSTQELLDGALGSGAAEVVLLPSDKDTRAVADVAAGQARDRGIRTAVIPTRSVVQTLAAVAVHSPEAHFDDDVVAMGREAGATRYGAVTVATKDALTTAGLCRTGDVLGLLDGDIVEIGDSLDSVAERILERMIGSGTELVTIVTGEQAGRDLVDHVSTAAGGARPGLEVEVIEGGQPRWPLILGAV